MNPNDKEFTPPQNLVDAVKRHARDCFDNFGHNSEACQGLNSQHHADSWQRQRVRDGASQAEAPTHCKCEHPYEGARPAGFPRTCERCGGLVAEAPTDWITDAAKEIADRYCSNWIPTESPNIEAVIRSHYVAAKALVGAVEAPKPDPVRDWLQSQPGTLKVCQREPVYIPENMTFYPEREVARLIKKYADERLPAAPSVTDEQLRLAQEITDKCEQYWNEFGICDAEIHAILEFIHERVRRMLTHKEK